MKKALALILALVLALSMAVSAFALTLDQVIVLEDEEDEAAKKTLKKLELDEDGDYYVMTDNGGTYYFLLSALAPENDGYSYLDDITVTATGCVEAEMIEFDPEVYNSIGETYVVLDDNGDPAYGPYDKYENAVAVMEKANEKYEVTYYTVAIVEDLYVVKVVIEPNYTTAYKLGKISIKATNVEEYVDDEGEDAVEETAVKATVNVVSDVAIFEYEKVKSASKLEKLLKVEEETGYSDYFHSGDYDKEDGKYVASDLRYEKATVISTTAFRALRETIKDGITVKANKTLYVEIPEIAAGQKGVNFVTETAANFFPASDKEEDGVVEVYNYDYYVNYGVKVPEALAFGFLGDQVVKGDFTVTAKLPYTYFELREFFGEAVEEDDIVTYYLLKDGKVAQEIVVDYMTADIYDEVELEIELADTTLGQYEIRVDVEVEAEAGEENPNTGAESVVGVVAALAVVSVATAAAVSLKK